MLTISSQSVGDLIEFNNYDFNRSGVKIYLIENDKTIGVANLGYDGCFVLTDLYILDNFNDDFNRSFFFRGIIFKLGSTNQKLKIKKDSRLIKYGFKEFDKYMTINCSEAKYPSLCKNNKEDK